MKTITTLVCLAALLAGCSDEKRPTQTAYEERNAPSADPTTVRQIPNKPSRETGEAAGERERLAPAEPDYYAGERNAEPLRVAPVTPGEAASEPDNTGVNRRDGDALTPVDQGSSESDRTITAEIRKAVVGDGTLSFTAKNVKIVTKDGNVVLRGPVKSEDERAAIKAKAVRVAGPNRVTDQLEVAK